MRTTASSTKPASCGRVTRLHVSALAYPRRMLPSTNSPVPAQSPALQRSTAVVPQVATLQAPASITSAPPVPAPSAPTLLPKLPQIKLPHNLRRRLFTHIDFIHLHASSASLSMLHGVYESARVGYEMIAHHQLPGPEANWVLPAVALLNITRDMTGLTLALQHRKGVVQRVFVSGALMSISFMLMLCYYDPSFPTATSGCDWATSLVRLALCITAPSMALLSLGDCTVNVGEFLGARDDKAIHKANAAGHTDDTTHTHTTEEPAAATTTQPQPEAAPAATASSSSGSVAERAAAAVNHAVCVASYYMPTALPTWIAALGALMVVAGGDDLRTYMMEHWPHYREMNFSWTMVGLMAGAVGSFATTLRDRYLITRNQEMAVIGLPFYYFIAVVAFSLCTYEDAWELLKVGYDPVFAHHLLSIIHTAPHA